jgi:hypothetical protein
MSAPATVSKTGGMTLVHQGEPAIEAAEPVSELHQVMGAPLKKRLILLDSRTNCPSIRLTSDRYQSSNEVLRQPKLLRWRRLRQAANDRFRAIHLDPTCQGLA